MRAGATTRNSGHALPALAEAGHGVAIVPSVLPTHRYRLRIVRLTYRGKSLREPMTILWDKRRALPAYAEDFCQALAAFMREIYPISRPSAPRARRRRTPAAAPA
jgi:DNA-binding transcriptional LysR family regulator